MFIVLLMLPGTYAQPPSIVADGENMRVEASRGSITLSANSKEVTVQAIVDGKSFISPINHHPLFPGGWFPLSSPSKGGTQSFKGYVDTVDTIIASHMNMRRV